MDSRDQKLEEYLLGNFERLPRDVVGVIVGQIDRKSLLNLCLSNKKFLGFCKTSKWFDKKALEYLEEKAPLSGHFRNLDEQVALIQKGFKSCYYALFESEYRDKNWNLMWLSFASEGAAHSLPDYVKMIKFEIVDLPPKKGTKVWLLGQTKRKYNTDGLSYSPGDNSYIFTSQEEAIEFLTSSGKRHFDVYEEDMDELVSVLIEERGILIKDEGENIFICLIQLSLP
jgi:hypothetical protein